MTVPSREEAARLLLSFDPPPWHVRHSRAVSEVAAWLARRIELVHPAVRVDRRLVETAGLLHDLDKAMPPAVRAKDLGHGDAAAAWLVANGYAELGSAVARHPVTRLVDANDADALARASIEARIVAYADKRAGERLESMASRFRRWDRSHRGGWPSSIRGAVWDRALALERDICGLAGCAPDDVARLRWTSIAFATAGRSGSSPSRS